MGTEEKELPVDRSAGEKPRHKAYKKGDLSEVSSEELIKKSYELTTLKDEILSEQLAINQELDERTAKEELDKMAAGLSPEARKRLAAHLVKTGTLAK